mgnify:FL=1
MPLPLYSNISMPKAKHILSERILKKPNTMNKQEAVNSLIDAITGSGKKFSEISKDAIYGFLKREGVPQNQWESIHEELKKEYQPKKSKNQNESQSYKDFVGEKTPTVNYSSDAHNEVKKREPRKSIFSEITKIAG